MYSPFSSNANQNNSARGVTEKVSYRSLLLAELLQAVVEDEAEVIKSTVCRPQALSWGGV